LTERQIDRETERQRGREAERQRGRETERQRDIKQRSGQLKIGSIRKKERKKTHFYNNVCVFKTLQQNYNV
jgi:hypothetical protein